MDLISVYLAYHTSLDSYNEKCFSTTDQIVAKPQRHSMQRISTSSLSNTRYEMMKATKPPLGDAAQRPSLSALP